MKNIIKAQQLKSKLDALRPINKEDELRIMQKFRLDWNYHSNHIEGNSLTYGETKALILFHITASGKPLKEHFEITGHNEAINWVYDIIKQEIPLTEKVIRELHELILHEPYEVNAITPDGNPTKKKIKIGEYKTIPNHVKTITGEIFRFATPEETPAKMQDLMQWLQSNKEKKDFNPVFVAANFHYQFIRIHPFDDGNGRIARILMNFILIQYGYPPVIIKTEDKNNYYKVLRQADAGIIEPFVDYIAVNLIHSLEIMIKGAKGEAIEEPDDIDKELTLLENKFNSYAKPIEILKSKEAILNIFENSIIKLITKYIDKASKFEKFYLENSLSKYIDLNFVKEVNEFINFINDENYKIIISYRYNAFNRGLQEMNFNSYIEFNFERTKYKVFNTNQEIIIEKLYSEQLTDEEINEIIKVEIKRHIAFIESNI